MATKKKTENKTNKTFFNLKGLERCTVIVKDATHYPLLSIHEFEGIKYRVDSIMSHPDGVAVEFVRVA